MLSNYRLGGALLSTTRPKTQYETAEKKEEMAKIRKDRKKTVAESKIKPLSLLEQKIIFVLKNENIATEMILEP